MEPGEAESGERHSANLAVDGQGLEQRKVAKYHLALRG